MFDATKAIIDFYEDSGEDKVSEKARDELSGSQERIRFLEADKRVQDLLIAQQQGKIERLREALKQASDCIDDMAYCLMDADKFVSDQRENAINRWNEYPIVEIHALIETEQA